MVSVAFDYPRTTRRTANQPPRVRIIPDPEHPMSGQPGGAISDQRRASEERGGSPPPDEEQRSRQLRGGSAHPRSTFSLPPLRGSSTSIATVNAHLPKGTLALPLFEGTLESRAQAHHFLSRTKRIFSLNPDTPDSYKLVALQACFPDTSPAAAWFELKFDQFGTFADFEEAFVARFGASDVDTSYLRRQLHRFRQRDSDGVNKFYAGLLDLSSRVALNGAPVSDTELVDLFVGGLKPSLSDLVFREQIRAGRAYKIDEIVKIAEDIERTERLASRKGTSGAPGANLSAFQKSNTGKWCAYHKTNTHNTDDCKRVIQLKKEGKWRGKASKSPDN